MFFSIFHTDVFVDVSIRKVSLPRIALDCERFLEMTV